MGGEEANQNMDAATLVNAARAPLASSIHSLPNAAVCHRSGRSVGGHTYNQFIRQGLSQTLRSVTSTPYGHHLRGTQTRRHQIYPTELESNHAVVKISDRGLESNPQIRCCTKNTASLACHHRPVLYGQPGEHRLRAFPAAPRGRKTPLVHGLERGRSSSSSRWRRRRRRRRFDGDRCTDERLHHLRETPRH